jgi:hypothetical protein
MIFTEKSHRVEVVDKIVVHYLVRFHNFWMSGRRDFKVLPLTVRTQDIFSSLNGSED